MFWAALATSFGCILFFSGSKYQTSSVSMVKSYITQWNLPQLGKLMGGTTVVLSSVLWYALLGAWLGLGATLGCIIMSYAILHLIKPNALHLISTCIALIGCSFIYTTINMVTHFI